MRTTFFLCCLLAAGGAWSEALSNGVRSRAGQLRDAALQGTGAFDLVRSLTVEVGPRFAGTPGDREAVRWAVRKLETMGFDRVWTEPVTVPRWERGEADGWIVIPYPREVVLVALGGSVGTPEAGIEAPVLEVESVEQLEELPDEQVVGRIVYFSRRMNRERSGRGYGMAVSIRSRGPAAAAAKGAVAAIIRSVGTDSHRIGHTGGTRFPEGARRIPAAALSNPDADLLSAQVATGQEVRFRLRLTSRRLSDGESANVIAEIRGRERPDEIVLIAAHLDSWDLGDGAVDDGSGCAIVMETARRIAVLDPGPRRTLRLVLYANEEFGLSGGRQYAIDHEDEISRHFVAAESDLGPGPVWQLATKVAEESLPIFAEVHELLAPLDIEAGSNQAYGGADISPLKKQGVPVVSLSPDASLYFDVHHTIDDTLDKVDPEHLDQSVAAWLAFTWAMLEGEFELPHLPVEEEARP